MRKIAKLITAYTVNHHTHEDLNCFLSVQEKLNRSGLNGSRLLVDMSFCAQRASFPCLGRILFVSLSTRYPLGVPRHSALNASSVLWDLQSFYPSLFPQLFIRAFPWGQIWHLWKGVEVSIPTVAFFFLNNSSYIPCIFHVISTFIIFFVSLLHFHLCLPILSFRYLFLFFACGAGRGRWWVEVGCSFNKAVWVYH